MTKTNFEEDKTSNNRKDYFRKKNGKESNENKISTPMISKDTPNNKEDQRKLLHTIRGKSAKHITCLTHMAKM